MVACITQVQPLPEYYDAKAPKLAPSTKPTTGGVPPSPALQFLTQYFRFGYFLGFLPYKIVQIDVKARLDDARESKFQIRTSTLHQMACALTHSISLYVYFAISRRDRKSVV